MNIHLPRDNEWNLQNKAIQQALGLADDPRFTAQIYTGVSHALTEVCFALSDLIPHKKTVTYFKNIGPDFDSVAVSLSKKELTLKAFAREEIEKPEYLTSLSKDLLMILTSVDDPILAARHNFSFLEEQLKEKRYFHIRLSNFTHLAEPIRLPSHYEVLVLPLTADRTLVIAGERAKLRPELAPKLRVDWNFSNTLMSSVSQLCLVEPGGRQLNLANVDKLKIAADKRREQILAFESDLPKGITAFFTKGKDPNGVDRIFDRSVLICEGVDGLSMITRLSEHIGREQPQVDLSGFETTSLCRWQNSKLFEYLYSQNYSPELLRGMILIDARFLNSAFKKVIEKVYKELLAEQNEVLSF